MKLHPFSRWGLYADNVVGSINYEKARTQTLFWLPIPSNGDAFYETLDDPLNPNLEIMSLMYGINDLCAISAGTPMTYFCQDNRLRFRLLIKNDCKPDSEDPRSIIEVNSTVMKPYGYTVNFIVEPYN